MVWSKQRLMMMLLRQTRPAELDLSVLRDEWPGALEAPRRRMCVFVFVFVEGEQECSNRTVDVRRIILRAR